jgi:preprotein translocase subunit SecF
MVVAVWLLGVGTLKDLALVQLVGILVGTYSSIFFATPLLVTLRERTEMVRTHTRRVNRRRSPDARASADADDSDAAEPAKSSDDETPQASEQDSTKAASAESKPVSNKPAPGARPVRPTGTRRPSGKRNAGRR